MGYLGNQSTVTGSQANKRLSSIATEGQTEFTVPGGYNINQLDVYLNGVKLSSSRDFNALDGVSVTLISAANSGDIVEFVVFENFDVADALTADGDQTITGNLIVTGSLVGAYVTTAGVATFAQGILGTPDVTLNSLFINEFVDTKNGKFSGIVTASQFDGNISGTAATFTGNVTVGGTLTYDDVTNIDSIGLITARNGLQVTGGITTISGQTNLANVNVSAAGTVATLNVTGQTSLANVSVSAASTFSGKINANAGVGFTGFLREGINIVSGKLSDNTTINVDHSLAHYFTTTETTTAIPNITSTAGINTDLLVGQTFSVNIITTAAAAGYSTGARIDAGATLPVLWNGGSDPSAGGSGGVDVYTFQVIKTGNATFKILGNKSNFA